MGVALFLISEVFFFISVLWAFFHSSLAPTVKLGAQHGVGSNSIDRLPLALLRHV